MVFDCDDTKMQSQFEEATLATPGKVISDAAYRHIHYTRLAAAAAAAAQDETLLSASLRHPKLLLRVVIAAVAVAAHTGKKSN